MLLETVEPEVSQSTSRASPAASCERGWIAKAEEMTRAGNLASAVEHYRRAIQVNPSSIAAWNNMGNVFASLKDWQTARAFLQEAERLSPQTAAIQNNLGNVLDHCGDAEQSMSRYCAAVALEPGNALFRNNLGNALRKVNEWRAAEEMLVSAITLRRDYPEAYANLAYLRYEQGRLAEAEELYRTAIEFDSHFALAHTCLAQLLLSRGAFQEGWQEQEWRWKWEDFPSPKRSFVQPQWFGEPIAGKTILLHAEQGFGDTIQFARYAPLVASLGAKVVLEVHPELVSLMTSLAGVSELISRGDPLPRFDLHCPLLSLPLAFGTTLETVPCEVPYLHNQTCRPTWLQNPDASSCHVGLVWAGNPSNRVDGRRSLPFVELDVLFSVPGVKFYSFQRGNVGFDEKQSSRFEAVLPDSGDFAATGSALCRMDLVITVDTALAHLAGSIGLPVWIVLPYVSDWRWLKDQTSSPWYPSVTLFRQTKERQWSGVLLQVQRALIAWTAKRLQG